MTIVRTKEELKRAVKNRDKHIRVEGPLAEQLIDKLNLENGVATGLGVGTISIGLILGLVSILAGSILIINAIKKNYNVKLSVKHGNKSVDLIFNK